MVVSYLHPHELAVSSWRWPRLRGSSRTPANARKLLKGVGSVWLRSVAHTLVLGPLTPRVSASSTVSQLSQPPAINELHQRQESCLTPLCIRKPLLDRTPGVNAGLCRWQVAGFGREAAVFTVPTLSLCLGTSGHLGSRRLEPTCAQATVLCVTPHTPKAHAGRVSRARLIEPPPRAQVWGDGFPFRDVSCVREDWGHHPNTRDPPQLHYMAGCSMAVALGNFVQQLAAASLGAQPMASSMLTAMHCPYRERHRKACHVTITGTTRAVLCRWAGLQTVHNTWSSHQASTKAGFRAQRFRDTIP